MFLFLLKVFIWFKVLINRNFLFDVIFGIVFWIVVFFGFKVIKLLFWLIWIFLVFLVIVYKGLILDWLYFFMRVFKDLFFIVWNLILVLFLIINLFLLGFKVKIW